MHSFSPWSKSIPDELLSSSAHFHFDFDMPNIKQIFFTFNLSIFGEAYRINGFARAFLSAGAASVLTNLWEVDDRISNQLLEHFYDQLHSGQSSTSALRTAQLRQIEQASNSDLAAPYYWAGHRLVGEKLEFSKNATSELPFSVTAILMLVITAVGIGIWRLRKF